MNSQTPTATPKVHMPAPGQCACGCGCGKPPITNILGRPLCEACCLTAMRRMTPGELSAILAKGGKVPQGDDLDFRHRFNALERRVEVLERLPVIRSIPDPTEDS